MLRLLLGSFSVAFSTVVFLASSPAVFAQAAPDCSSEKALKSLSSTAATELSFQNRSADKRRIYWIDQDGDRKFYGIVEPGNAFRQPTFANHAWVVTDDAEKCLYAFIASNEPRVVDVGAAAAVVAPPPGGQQPIAQAPVAPPAPQVVAPPPAVVQAPPPVATAAPPQQIAADPLPQVSPVEQFQLDGVYRLSSRVDGSKFLNGTASGTIDVVSAKPQWDSAQWTFEAVPGTPFVRIRNKWKGTYLADFNGKPRAMPASPDDSETHWTFEPVDGTEFVQFRNRETDRFLLAIKGAAAVVASFGQEQENSSHWRNTPLGSAVAVASPIQQRPRYDSAVASCREIGGYWTGSSCRRPVYLTEPLSCPRGFVWAEDVGECLWDEGGCPPWQAGPGGVCGVNLVCRGGAVAPGRRGYPACYCPPGEVAWGNYPNFSCVVSITRVTPYLIPAVIGGVALGIISGSPQRPPVGVVFGNKQFCPPGQTGTPPNCVTAQSCPSPLVGRPPNCIRQMPRPVTPVNNITGGRPTPTPTAIPTATPIATPGVVSTPAPTPTPTSGAGRACLNNEAISTGCRCELPMRQTPNGTCFVTPSAGQACLDGQNMSSGCVCLLQKFDIAGGGSVCAASAPRAGTTTVCQIGQTKDAGGNCVSLSASIICTGGKIDQGVCGCPGGTRLTGSGRNFQCVAATPTPTPTPTPATGGGATGGGQTGTQTTTPTGGGPPLCTDGQNTASGCRCAAPLTVLPGGKCSQPTARGAACLEGQNIAQTGCNCVAPLKPIENGFCGRLLLNETKPLARGGICKQGDDIKATGCTCNMNTVDAGGGKFICSSVAYATCTDGQLMGGTNCQCRMKTVKVGNNTYCTASGKAPLVGGASCTEGQSTAGGCRCVLPLVDLPGGRCGKPTRGGACLEGQNIAQTGCTCTAPLKPIENGVCGRLLLNETKPTSKGGTCGEGQDIIATKCTCLMKTVDRGGGKFICSANAAPSGIRTAPAPTPGRPGTTTAPSPIPTATPKPTTAPPPPPKAVTPPPPKPVVAPPPPKPVVIPPRTPTAVPKPVVAPSPAPKPTMAPPPPKPVVAPPPPPKPAPPPACAPPKKLNPAGQCV